MCGMHRFGVSRNAKHHEVEQAVAVIPCLELKSARFLNVEQQHEIEQVM